MAVKVILSVILSGCTFRSYILAAKYADKKDTCYTILYSALVIFDGLLLVGTSLR